MTMIYNGIIKQSIQETKQCPGTDVFSFFFLSASKRTTTTTTTAAQAVPCAFRTGSQIERQSTLVAIRRFAVLCRLSQLACINDIMFSMPSAPVASFPYNEATQNGRGKSGGSEELKSVTDSESAEAGAGGDGGSVKGSVVGSSVSSELSEAGAGVGGSVNGSVAGSSVSSELSVSYRRARRKAMKPGCKSNSIGSGHGKGREQHPCPNPTIVQ